MPSSPFRKVIVSLAPLRHPGMYSTHARLAREYVISDSSNIMIAANVSTASKDSLRVARRTPSSDARH